MLKECSRKFINMSNVKVKIDKNMGVIEVEGSETFVKEMIEKYSPLILTLDKKPDKPLKPTEPVKPDAGKRRKPSSTSIEAVEIDLSAGTDYPSLKDFYTTKNPGSFLEKTTLFTYYLKQYKNIEEATPGHLLTCYRSVGSELPKIIPQGILNAKQKGWLTADSSVFKAKIANIGINLIEHELPRKKKVN
jgi:hypothetical protein